MLPLFVLGLALWLATDTTRRVSRYGATGMVAGMAAMMAAMGTGLSVGYAAGMVWDLGWATLAGVAAGFGHGLWMGRRYGPMAALDGAGGGVMGGLMGPMLAVMLLALPLSLLWTAGLMLALQWVFSIGAIYLVAAAAGAAGTSGWLRLAGRVLGAQTRTAAAAQAAPDHYAALGVSPDATTEEIGQAYLQTARVAADRPAQLAAAREALAILSDPVRRARYDAARLEGLECCPPEPAPSAPPAAMRRAHRRAVARETEPAQTASRRAATSALVGLGALLAAAAACVAQSAVSQSEERANSAAADQQPAAAPVGPDGVQQVAITLRAPYYGPPVTEVKRGVPVKLTLQAVGDPG